MNSSKQAEWDEAKRRCRLSDAAVAMAKELGLNPRSLIKNIPNKSEPWKAPVEDWVRHLHAKRFGQRPPPPRPEPAAAAAVPEPIEDEVNELEAAREELLNKVLYADFTFDRFAPRGEHAVVLFDRAAGQPAQAPAGPDVDQDVPF